VAQITAYGDISPAVAAWSVVKMLKRGVPLLQLEQFGQAYPLPTNSTQTAKFRRYFLSGATGSAGSGSAANPFFIPLATTPLVEGVTPVGNKLANQDYTATLAQYGDFITISDVIVDTHTDEILAQATDVLGESAASTVETLRYNVLKAGTNVFYASKAASRAALLQPITLADIRRVATGLNRQNAQKISSVISSSADYNTKSVERAYFAVVHPDVESDIRNLAGFKPVADYGPHTSPLPGEIGSVEQIRFLTSTIIAPFGDAASSGGASTTTFRSTASNYPDVYPVLFFGRDAFGIVPLKGKSSMTPMVVNPKPAAGDPLAQRGTVGWKLYTTTVILNDAWMARLEVLATA